MEEPESNTPFEELSPEEQVDEAEKVFREGMEKLAEHVSEAEVPISFVVIAALPPGYERVRFGSNLDQGGMASLIMATADTIRRNAGGRNGDDSDIVTPGQ